MVQENNLYIQQTSHGIKHSKHKPSARSSNTVNKEYLSLISHKSSHTYRTYIMGNESSTLSSSSPTSRTRSFSESTQNSHSSHNSNLSQTSTSSHNSTSPSTFFSQPAGHPHKQTPTPRPSPLRLGSELHFSPVVDPRSPRPEIRVGFPFYEDVLMEAKGEKKEGIRGRMGMRIKGLRG